MIVAVAPEATAHAVAKPEWRGKVQQAWSERSVAERLQVLKRWRHAMARRSDEICASIVAAPARTPADVRATEILPLLAACAFLERNAARILEPRVLGRKGRPAWLMGVRSEIHRVPLGRVLVIGASNYPLFLPGVQVLQALAAGNTVTWKPGHGGRAVAKFFAAEMTDAGLPRELLRLTEESEEAGRAAIAAGADKVFFTGSSTTGREVMRALAETATPSVMELSGCSSVIVLPEAELGRVTEAIRFGLRLNGSATCMAPRRVLVMGRTTERRNALVRRLQTELAAVPAATLTPSIILKLHEMVEEATAAGATILGEVADARNCRQRPLLVVDATPEMRIAQTDLFAPVLSILDVADPAAALAAERACPYALTVSIFGEEQIGRHLAASIAVGTVLINDLIVSTADPRIPFGGRRGSGFGVTRGSEGLLGMTAIKTVLVQSGTSLRRFQETGEEHRQLFDGMILATHGGSWTQRLQGLRQVFQAGRRVQAQEKKAPQNRVRERTGEA